MSKLVVFMSMSLDGFISGADDGPGAGLGTGGEGLHAWLDFGSAAGRPTQGANAEVFDEFMATGAVVTGRHTFDWAGQWGGDHHGVPIFVLTRNVPEPAVQGYVHWTSDLAAAVAQAKAAAGERDVMMHGASAVQALLSQGLVDEIVISLVPIVLGQGRRLFGDEPGPKLNLIQSREGDGVLHLRYQVAQDHRLRP